MKQIGRYQAATIIAGIAAVALVALYALGSPELRATMEARLEWLLAVVVLPFVQARMTRDSDGDGIPDDLDDTPHGPPPAGGSAGAALLLIALAFSAATQGCGTAAQQHRTLDAITDVADPTYELAVRGCDDARNYILARQGSTEDADRADMATINAICDSVVEGFEALRGSQLTARQWLDEGLGGAAEELVRQALASWAELRALVPRIQQLTSGAES